MFVMMDSQNPTKNALQPNMTCKNFKLFQLMRVPSLNMLDFLHFHQSWQQLLK